MKIIDAQELKEKIDAGEDFEFVDVLSKESYEGNHIPNSKSIPLDELEDKASKELPDKNREIVVYCASNDCHASTKAVKKLEEMGYTNIVDFKSGLKGWQEAGYSFTSKKNDEIPKKCSCCG